VAFTFALGTTAGELTADTLGLGYFGLTALFALIKAGPTDLILPALFVPVLAVVAIRHRLTAPGFRRGGEGLSPSLGTV